MVARTEPFAPPFEVGDRITYRGNSWARDAKALDPSTALWVHDGQTGTVISTNPGWSAAPGEPYPGDGWSVVRWDHDPDGVCNAAVSFDEADDGSPIPPTRYQKAVPA